jgi:hypothetical protein
VSTTRQVYSQWLYRHYFPLAEATCLVRILIVIRGPLFQKYRALLKYCESESDDSNVFEYRFAKHSRFVLWLHNLHYRHRTLSQGKIYLRQCPTDANMPITELQSLIDRSVFENPVQRNMQRYMANKPGSPSYWYRYSQDLSALIASFGTAYPKIYKIFFCG